MSDENPNVDDAAAHDAEQTAADAAEAKAPAGREQAEEAAHAPAPDEPGAKSEAAPKSEAEAETEDPPAKPARRRRGRGRGGEPTEPPATPVAAPRRRGAAHDGPPPLVRARAKYVRSSARKARLVCDQIRGKSVEDARAILAMTTRAVARDWSKLLESAVANAENNHELVGEELRIAAVTADEGPTLKRFRPRAMGRATPIRKRTSHLTILLTPKE